MERSATIEFAGVVLTGQDSEGLARFWGGLLGREVVAAAGSAPAGQQHTLRPASATDLRFAFRAGQAPKAGQNRIHLDLTSQSPEHHTLLIARALDLGGARVDIGQTEAEPHEVLADPEGNEFCIIEPENRFLAGTGAVGAVNCDGTRALGYFWSRALGWPLVWDQDQETAIQAPAGGPKITWSGPPLMARPDGWPERWELQVRPATSTGVSREVAIARLIELGATRGTGSGTGTGTGSGSDPSALYDPDGNRIAWLPTR